MKIALCEFCRMKKKELEHELVASHDVYAELSLFNLTEFFKRVTGDLNNYKSTSGLFGKDIMDLDLKDLFLAE